jgi:hypothetical protein
MKINAFWDATPPKYSQAVPTGNKFSDVSEDRKASIFRIDE